MIIVNSIAERNATEALAWRLRADGKWEGAEMPAELGAITPAPAPTTVIISAAEFRDRFTSAELLGISTLAYSGTGDPAIQLLLLKVATNRDGIDLASADVIAGLDYLIAKGKLLAGRKTEILK